MDWGFGIREVGVCITTVTMTDGGDDDDDDDAYEGPRLFMNEMMNGERNIQAY